MRDIFEFVVPAVFVLLFFALFLGFAGWLRWMRFRETLALADRGYAPVGAPNGTNRTLRWGLILVAIGLALACGMAPFALEALDRSPVLIPGLLFLFVGLALLLYWLLSGGRATILDRSRLTPLPAPVWPPRADAAPLPGAPVHDGAEGAGPHATDDVTGTDAAYDADTSGGGGSDARP